MQVIFFFNTSDSNTEQVDHEVGAQFRDIIQMVLCQRLPILGLLPKQLSDQ
jgi:hypothetical protein